MKKNLVVLGMLAAAALTVSGCGAGKYEMCIRDRSYPVLYG